MRFLRICGGLWFPAQCRSLKLVADTTGAWLLVGRYFLSPITPAVHPPSAMFLPGNRFGERIAHRWSVSDLRKLRTGQFFTRAHRLQLCALAILAAFAGDLAAYFWPQLPRFWTRFFFDLDYVAIVLGGISFGARGGLITAAIAGISHTAVQQFGFERPFAVQGELTVFMLVGLLAGFFAEHRPTSGHLAKHAEGSLRQSSWLELSPQTLGQQIAPGLVHQLRTPLASIEGAAFVLEDGELPDEKRRELVAIVLKECQKLNLLIGLMDGDRSHRLEDGTIDIALLLDDVVHRALDIPHASLLRIEKEIAPDLPQLRGDCEAVEQAILNLVLDAMKAMPQGGRIVLASRAVNDEILIQVTDQRSQANANRLRRAVNSVPMGYWPELELAVAQRIVIRQGGAMRIEQNGEVGLTFSVILPRMHGAYV